MKTFYSKNLSV